MNASVIKKYSFYERAVQSPEKHAEWFATVYRDLNGTDARALREDFCGTFRISCEWVKRHPDNKVMGLDLDPEPLAYGKLVNSSKLTVEQRRRLKILRQNVLNVTRPGSDLIVACNFSFYIFRKRQELVDYFKACRQSLRPGGVLILEMAGGPGMQEETCERRTFRRNGKPWFTYIWDQQSFDPITREARYAIHFSFPGGKRMNEVFTYHWRLWTVPEVREALEEAGFSQTHVYWETEHNGKGTGEYIRTQKGDNSYAWLAYVAGHCTV